jgi:hypothetical protein
MLAGFVKRRKWLVRNLRQCLLSGRDAPRVESLAVLPFTTNAAGETSEYLADGITEGVINDLQVPTLRVRPGAQSSAEPVIEEPDKSRPKIKGSFQPP